MEYIKNFDEHTEYETYISTSGMQTPFVTRCNEEKHVHYGKKDAYANWEKQDLSKKYVKFVSYEPDSFYIKLQKYGGVSEVSLEYSINGGNWRELQYDTFVYADYDERGSVIRFRHEKGSSSDGISESDTKYATFIISGSNVYCSGNIMTLLNEQGEDIQLRRYAFNNLFNGCTALKTAPELPSMNLSGYCYSAMFRNCTSLTTAPVLPATTLSDGCYFSMFSNCTSLSSSPSLPATSLVASCYYNMFYGTNVLPDCSNIDFNSDSVVASRGLKGLFAGTKVTYQNLLNILPIQKNRPVLPANIVSDCYTGMFTDCQNLTDSPVLLSTTLQPLCYSNMFKGCTSLTAITALFIDSPAVAEGFVPPTNNWVQGVPEISSCVFTKNTLAQWDVRGVHGIPNNWSTQTMPTYQMVAEIGSRYFGYQYGNDFYVKYNSYSGYCSTMTVFYSQLPSIGSVSTIWFGIYYGFASGYGRVIYRWAKGNDTISNEGGTSTVYWTSYPIVRIEPRNIII